MSTGAVIVRWKASAPADSSPTKQENLAMSTRTSMYHQKCPGTEDTVGCDHAEVVQDAVRRTVVVNGKRGLHMRVCLAIVSTVGKHQAKVMIYRDGKVADATSILELMSLAAARGTTLFLSAVGPEAEEALESILPIFDTRAD